MAEFDVKYIRYMDDILILAKTRWKLKKAVKEMSRILESLLPKFCTRNLGKIYYC